MRVTQQGRGAAVTWRLAHANDVGFALRITHPERFSPMVDAYVSQAGAKQLLLAWLPSGAHEGLPYVPYPNARFAPSPDAPGGGFRVCGAFLAEPLADPRRALPLTWPPAPEEEIRYVRRVSLSGDTLVLLFAFNRGDETKLFRTSETPLEAAWHIAFCIAETLVDGTKDSDGPPRGWIGAPPPLIRAFFGESRGRPDTWSITITGG